MSNPWLYEHRRNVTSQTGEDGVVAAIFDKIGVRNKFCVDVGASDGYFISNSYYWVMEHQWGGCLFEPDPRRFADLSMLYEARSDVTVFNEALGANKGIDDYLDEVGAPNDFDLLSIDIDGMDYWIWKAMEKYRPRLVIIEVNCSMAPDVHFIQHKEEDRFGSSAAAMVALAREKGYELVAHLVSNCIFVRKEDFDAVEVGDNSLERLFTSPFVPKVISDLDGVHYILKEGPWGFSGTVFANDARPRETGTPCAARHERITDQNGVFRASAGGKFGFEAFITGPKERKSILRNFVDTMEVAFKRREKMR